jgi:tRNA dimethylallyltransferase
MVATVSTDPLTILLLGPTGSGKTALSLRLAEFFNGEIISCDSVAVYRGMDLRSARAALREIAARNHLPIVTGGTGLYLRALTEGLFSGPARQEPLRGRLRASAKKHAPNHLHKLLQRLDAPTAARIHANDTPKLIRAIEVSLAGRKPMSQQLARDPLIGFRLLRIGLNPPRTALYDRLNRRCAEMFAAGLIEETRTLLTRHGRVKALDSLGYRQALAVLDGAFTEPEALTAAQQGHRNYAKRQLTWFRREPEVHWLTTFGDDPATADEAITFVRNQIQ